MLPEIDLVKIDGKVENLADYNGKTLLIVNVASNCGFTPQYSGLQQLFDRYKDDGLVVLGVPSNDFNQELHNDEEVKKIKGENWLNFFKKSFTPISK